LQNKNESDKYEKPEVFTQINQDYKRSEKVLSMKDANFLKQINQIFSYRR
jgi:hypothetical protein